MRIFFLHRSPIVESGFSLVELLVVLGILALVGVFVPAVVQPPQREYHVQAIGRSLASQFRYTRSLAIRRNTEETVLFDATDRSFRFPGSNAITLSGGTSATVYVARQSLPSSRGGITFFSDGSSSGGRIVLRTSTETVEVIVDWMTGHATAK